MENYSFEKDGFVILRNVFSESDLQEKRKFLNQLVSHTEKGYEDPFEKYYLPHRPDQGVLYDLAQRHPEFNTFIRNENILTALEEVLDDSIFLYENSLVYKPPGKKNGVPFHQDFISRPNEPLKFIAWMAIDNVTKETGALKVIPGSHKKGFRKWYRVEGETHHDRMDLADVDMTKVMHVELAPGDVLIFNQLLVHGSDEMNSSSMRYVYRASFQSFQEIFTPRATPIVVRGGDGMSLAKRFTTPKKVKQPISLLNRIIHAIGRKMVNW